MKEKALTVRRHSLGARYNTGKASLQLATDMAYSSTKETRDIDICNTLEQGSLTVIEDDDLKGDIYPRIARGCEYTLNCRLSFRGEANERKWHQN